MIQKMTSEQFKNLKTLINCHSPIGFEGAMTHGFLQNYFNSFTQKNWRIHKFKGNAGIIFDTNPEAKDQFTIMLLAHADKIRLQVRSIGKDGKIWVDSDSFLPTTLIGHEVTLFSQDPATGNYRAIEGGTIEAVGAIHFADPKLRSGEKGIKATQLYLELQMYGENADKKLQSLGIAPGDPILLKRPIRKGFAPHTITGAYMDDGLGCFVEIELAKIIATLEPLKNIRLLFAFSPYEEIGRFGSAVLAHELNADLIIALDVTHDYKAAPGIGEQRFPETTIGAGPVLETGSITSPQLNSMLRRLAKEQKLPLQIQGCGRDTGTDAMAAVKVGIDAAAMSIGIPLRNMHTISEIAHTGDIMATIELLRIFIDNLETTGFTAEQLAENHIQL